MKSRSSGTCQNKILSAESVGIIQAGLPRQIIQMRDIQPSGLRTYTNPGKKFPNLNSKDYSRFYSSLVAPRSQHHKHFYANPFKSFFPALYAKYAMFTDLQNKRRYFLGSVSKLLYKFGAVRKRY